MNQVAEETEREAGTEAVVKKFMFVNRKAPHGTIYALEGLEVVLISAAFDQDVSLAFLDDGVYQLLKGQETKSLGVKNFSPTYRALEGYDVEKLYVERESLEQGGQRARAQTFEGLRHRHAPETCGVVGRARMSSGDARVT